ncbi:MAG: hypothetical protein CL570_00375 [Alphaproteobacteria bacterium]|nr:hypothetical protein [Alphaproteobacteria bacterium]|tara:strand:- start:4522 stop:5115 length:594 start_codon:yes stop_codon:yes gene_type:complete
MPNPTQEEIRALMDLFHGFDQKIGRTNVIEVFEHGKSESKSWTEDGSAAFSQWEKHIKSDGAGLGIVPLRDDNTILWGAIDIDVYPIDIDDLFKKVTDSECPLIVFRSKSGGAHLIAFFDEPVPADKGQQFLQHWAHKLGFGNAEIFPKQTTRNNSDEVGNWLNMPYYGGMDGGRYAIINGKPVTLTQFLKGMNDEN